MLAELIPEPILLLRWIPLNSVGRLGQPSVYNWLDCCLARESFQVQLVGNFGVRVARVLLTHLGCERGPAPPPFLPARFLISLASFSSFCFIASRFWIVVVFSLSSCMSAFAALSLLDEGVFSAAAAASPAATCSSSALSFATGPLGSPPGSSSIRIS